MLCKMESTQSICLTIDKNPGTRSHIVCFFTFNAISGPCFLHCSDVRMWGQNKSASGPLSQGASILFSIFSPPTTGISLFRPGRRQKKKKHSFIDQINLWCVADGTWKSRVQSFDQYIWTVQDEMDICGEECFSFRLRVSGGVAAGTSFIMPARRSWDEYIFNGRKEQRRWGSVEDGH